MLPTHPFVISMLLPPHSKTTAKIHFYFDQMSDFLIFLRSIKNPYLYCLTLQESHLSLIKMSFAVYCLYFVCFKSNYQLIIFMCWYLCTQHVSRFYLTSWVSERSNLFMNFWMMMNGKMDLFIFRLGSFNVQFKLLFT